MMARVWHIKMQTFSHKSTKFTFFEINLIFWEREVEVGSFFLTSNPKDVKTWRFKSEIIISCVKQNVYGIVSD